MRLREILLRSHTVDAGILAQAEQMSAATGAPIVHILVRYRVVEGRRMARLLSRACHVELIDVAAIDIHKRLLEVVPRHAAEQLRVLPIGVKKSPNGERLYLAMSDPSNDATVDVVEKATGRVVEVMCCDDEALAASLDRHYGPVVVEAPVVVGALDARGEFLTESTSEALRLVQSVRSAELPQLSPLDFASMDEPTIEVARQQRPASIALAAALAEVTADTARGSGKTSLPTMQEVWGGASSATTLEPAASDDDYEPDEPLFDQRIDPQPPKQRADDPPSILPSAPRVIVSTPPGLSPTQRAELLSELLDLLGAVDLDDDAVAACRAASKGRALVLLSPRPQSALLRALLDLEEKQPRPRIVVLGGDPALRMLAFVDHHAELPDAMGPSAARGVAVAVMVALRHVGVRL